MAIAPHRFLANDRNLLRDAVLTASSVLAVTNKVLQLKTARSGNAQVSLSGTYTGDEEALYEIQIVDADPDVNRISAPIAGANKGSGTVTGIAATGAAQTYTIECNSAGIAASAAQVTVEGQKIVARTEGASGNDIRISVDQSTLVFEPSGFSLLADISAGQGGPTDGFTGQGFDWDCKALSSDGIIPADAHRIAFGDDRSKVYLSYKAFETNDWRYHLVPALARDIPRGTQVYFVTGGREVTITDGVTPEPYPDIETAYDLLNAIRTTSLLVEVDGVVTNDRTPTGQAARELSLRTDAHAEPSTGSGSKYATGFVDVTVKADAATELITATCFAVGPRDHPLAGLGRELWELKGSISGNLGTITTGIPTVQDTFGATIPVKLPPGFGTPKGRFTVESIDYATRGEGETEPPICPVALTLGPDASDQTITLTYRTRATGDCECADMPVPNLNGEDCLGNLSEGGDDMSEYSAANRARLIDLYGWFKGVVRDGSARYHGTFGRYPFQFPFLSQPGSVYNFNPEPLRLVVRDFEQTLRTLNDELGEGESPDLRGDGEAAWDAAVTQLKDDIAEIMLPQTEEVEAFESLDAGDAVCTFINNDGDKMVRKAVPGGLEYGFVLTPVTAGSPGAMATVYYYGINNALPGGRANGAVQYMQLDSPGSWTEDPDPTNHVDFAAGAYTAVAVADAEIIVERMQWLSVFGRANSVLSDRYRAALDEVLITAGISPLGKADASSVIESGDGCWRDTGASSWWEVVGSDKGGYAPLFTNEKYFSCRLSPGGKYYSTHEFALQLNVKPECVDDLKDGDRVTLKISDAGYGSTYQIGDELLLPLVAAGPLFLSGGRDASPAQTWNVRGSVDGPLADYSFNPDAPVAYSDSGLSFLLEQGGIAFAAGDRFKWSVEGGHYRWRVNGGTWNEGSPPYSIPASAVEIEEGLFASFFTGAATSFVADDIFKFRALQPWAVSNVQAPTAAFRAWKWADSSPEVATLDADLGSTQQLDMVALVLSLPDGATVELSGGLLAADEWTEVLTYDSANGQAWKAIDRTARYVRLTFTDATGGHLRYAWLGVPLTTELTGDWNPSYVYAANRGSGLIQGGRFLGRGVRGEFSWPTNAISEDEVADHVAMIDAAKENDDEPIILIPQVTRTSEPFVFGVIDADGVEFADDRGYQPDADRSRRLSGRIPIAGILQ